MSDPLLRLSATSPDLSGELAGFLAGRAPRAGRCRVFAIEGRSGAGKTRLAAELSRRTGWPVVHMDDIYPGWEGLAGSVPLVRHWIVAPLMRGGLPRWRRYDWQRGEYGPWEETPVGRELIVEGCGCGARELRPYLAALVWVDADARVRAERLDARFDAAVYAPYRSVWARQEERFHVEHCPRGHADVVVDNS
ncbi:isopentenyl transferase family protein [Salinactinospora qingdaonensis]|uniref:AAA family ATPase n=1 Tax=Salinactinospora qingdaonensis TaxID=702744 RepID=A0ABP7F4N4_9ACTN